MRYRLVNLSKGGDSEQWINGHAEEGYRIVHIVQPSTATAPTTMYHPMAIMERRTFGAWGYVLLLLLVAVAALGLGWLKAKGY